MIREKIKSKSALYLFLFLLLNLIEWLKATQDGDIWMVAVNCTGLVMMVIIVSAYPLREFWSRMNAVWTGICVVAMVGVYAYWSVNTVPFILWKYLTGVMNIWWIVMVAVFMLRRWKNCGMPKIKWNVLGILWVLLSAVMILSASSRVWPVWFLFMFGMFYLTEYTESDKNALINGMVNGTIISFFIIQIYAYGFRPYDEVRYKGAFGNCNMMALYYLIVYCMVLIKLHFLQLKGAKKWEKAFWLLGAGGLLCFTFMTLCRTAILSAAVITVVYGIWVMKGKWKLNFQGIIGRAILLGMSALVTFPLVFGTIRWLPTILHRPIWYSGEYHVDKVHSFDPADSWKYVSLEEFLESALGRFAQLLMVQEADHRASGLQDTSGASVSVGTQIGVGKEKENGTQSATGTDKAEDSRNAVEVVPDTEQQEMPVLGPEKEWTSGEIRMAIFKCYTNDLNLRGHSESEGYYLITEDYRSWHAQNLWLQVAYYYGIPAGILLVVITIVMIYYYLRRYAKGMHDKRYGMIPILLVLLYFTFGILETVWNPGQLIVCLFFMVQHPMFRKINEENK